MRLLPPSKNSTPCPNLKPPPNWRTTSKPAPPAISNPPQKGSASKLPFSPSHFLSRLYNSTPNTRLVTLLRTLPARYLFPAAEPCPSPKGTLPYSPLAPQRGDHTSTSCPSQLHAHATPLIHANGFSVVSGSVLLFVISSSNTAQQYLRHHQSFVVQLPCTSIASFCFIAPIGPFFCFLLVLSVFRVFVESFVLWRLVFVDTLPFLIFTVAFYFYSYSHVS